MGKGKVEDATAQVYTKAIGAQSFSLESAFSASRSVTDERQHGAMVTTKKLILTGWLVEAVDMVTWTASVASGASAPAGGVGRGLPSVRLLSAGEC